MSDDPRRPEAAGAPEAANRPEAAGAPGAPRPLGAFGAADDTAPALDPSQRPGPLRVEPPLGRGNVERSPVPSHRRAAAGTDRYGERLWQVPVTAAIAIVATIVVGQLWALTVALDAWLDGDEAAARWTVAFQAASFLVALVVWRATPRDR